MPSDQPPEGAIKHYTLHGMDVYVTRDAKWIAIGPRYSIPPTPYYAQLEAKARNLALLHSDSLPAKGTKLFLLKRLDLLDRFKAVTATGVADLRPDYGSGNSQLNVVHIEVQAAGEPPVFVTPEHLFFAPHDEVTIYNYKCDQLAELAGELRTLRAGFESLVDRRIRDERSGRDPE